MNIHKRARLTPLQRQEIFEKYHDKGVRICDLARQYSTYKIIHRGKHQDFFLHKSIKSINKRFRCLEYGLKRLAKVEAELEKKLKPRLNDTTSSIQEK